MEDNTQNIVPATETVDGTPVVMSEPEVPTVPETPVEAPVEPEAPVEASTPPTEDRAGYTCIPCKGEGIIEATQAVCAVCKGTGGKS